MSPVLQDKVAIITGGGRGLGRSFALRFAREGAKVLIPDISLERAEDAVKEIKGKGGEAAAMEVDISDEKSTEKIAENVMQLYGKVDILVNNAAIWYGVTARSWDSWTASDWDRILGVNVKGMWLCCKAIAPLMVKQSRGKIINIASNVARVPGAHLFLPYSCSKGAVYTLTYALARALGPSGINVNAIGPGLTASEATLAQPGGNKVFDFAVKEQAIQRRAEPADMVGTVVFLASSESDFVSGQIIYIDGGTVML